MALNTRSLGKRLLASSWVRSLIGFLTARYVTLVKATTKWQVTNGHHLTDQLAGAHGLIIITWHSRLMMIPAGWPGAKPLHILVSRHGDGDLVGRVMVHFGMVTVRGSTHRPNRNYEADREKGGSAALRQLLALLKDGQVIGLTPDGPRGPARQLSDGVITLARLSGAPILPVVITTARHRRLRSWDRFRIALPFSKGARIFGEPIIIARGLDKPGQEDARIQVEAALNAVTDQADQMLGHTPDQYPGHSPNGAP